jgi:hypothetical protein
MSIGNGDSRPEGDMQELADEKLTAEDYADIARQGRRREWFTEYFALVAKRQREQKSSEVGNEVTEEGS